MARVAKSRVPRVLDLLKPALDQMVRLGASAANTEMDDAVADAIALDDEARSELHGEGPQTEFAYRMAWVRTWLKNAGLLESVSRAVWSLTPEGRSQAELSATELGRLVQGRLRRAASPSGQSKDAEATAEPEAVVGWQEALLAVLVELTPDGFERLCQRLLREAGFVKVEVTGRSGDNGIDGIGVLRMNLVSFQVLFQCKRWKGSVGSSVVRDFRGAMVGRADKGLIITTGTFTREARNEATRDGAPAIDLVDGADLCDLLHRYRIGVRVKLVEEVTVEAEALRAV